MKLFSITLQGHILHIFAADYNSALAKSRILARKIFYSTLRNAQFRCREVRTVVWPDDAILSAQQMQAVLGEPIYQPENGFARLFNSLFDSTQEVKTSCA